MKDRPMLFQPDMIRAQLDGRKTQTRRIFKIDTPDGKMAAITSPKEEVLQFEDGSFHYLSTGDLSGPYPCPYGQPGDLLWCRETHIFCPKHPSMDRWSHTPEEARVIYPADGEIQLSGPHGLWKPKKRPSIHMPRWASRLTLRITDVRVERVQDISEQDAKAEGVAFHSNEYGYCGYGEYAGMGPAYFTARQSFQSLWNSIYAAPSPVKENGLITHYVSYPWEDIQETREHKGLPWYVYGNPWVWPISFDVIHDNVDNVIARSAA